MTKLKKPRRANGEGHIRQLPDGRWMAKKLVLHPDGAYRQVKAEAKTRAQAVARLAEKVKRIAAGGEGARVPIVAEYLETWYRDTFTPRAEVGSLRTYRSLIDKQLAPYLGAIRLDRLAAPRLRSWLAELDRAGLSAKTIAMARSVLNQALDQAVDDRIIAYNPLTRRIKGPPVAKTAGKALTVEQARQLLDAARGERLEAAIRLALSLGLRRAEVCGLRWQDVDLAAGRLTIAGQAIYNPGEGTTWKPKTKTAAGRRSIRLPAVLVGALRWHQERQRGERAALGWPPSPYLFTSETTGELLSPAILYDTFKRIARAVDLGEFRFHDLRHSAATFLLAQGVKLKKVQEILGHVRGSTTLDVYGHLLPGDDDDATDRVARLLDEPPPADDAQEAAG